MANRDGTSIFPCLSFLPNKLSYKALLSKHLIAQPFQISLFIIVNRYKDYTIVSKQIACE